MIKILKISDMDKFLEKVQKCEGDVNLHLPDGTVCDLKKDHTAMQILSMLHTTDHELDISLTDPRDYAPIMRYMMCSAA